MISEYNSENFNIGINQGAEASASIEHIHIHIVPRYPHETGFLDVIGGVRVIVEPLEKTYKRLKPLFEKI